MLKRITLLIFAIVLAIFAVHAQTGQGTIKGKMLDKATKEPLPFANVVVFKGGAQIAGTQTDFDGKYTFTALTPGKYEVRATYVGYQKISLTGVVVNSGKITYADIKADQGVTIDDFVKVGYKIPLISKDQTSSGATVDRETISKLARSFCGINCGYCWWGFFTRRWEWSIKYKGCSE